MGLDAWDLLSLTKLRLSSSHIKGITSVIKKPRTELALVQEDGCNDL